MKSASSNPAPFWRGYQSRRSANEQALTATHGKAGNAGTIPRLDTWMRVKAVVDDPAGVQ
jgi:hypothetical protein